MCIQHSMYSYIRKKPTLRQKNLAMKQWLMSATVRVGLFLWVALFGVLYVIQTTAVSTKGFAISDLEQKKEELHIEVKKMEADIASHRSLQAVEARLQESDLVRAEAPQYITLGDTTVAQR
ncbi:MAG TPA: hypothetical protein DCY48_04160 [Candidatus Magasanikbacteria bacterium]|nr:MAG: hypothetical protein A3I74_00285 [Candidatus Magasanikbacteria bacterium RIFCSPLOWO2_02_FULL_47_16]OGH80110.1 MAG: hypothetical protein A3C10_02945 [Candidatus Magasanikbacteria bacterium RIFCSPHIGHO2_02_FULL_48_18]OGH83189.1 MAG: hypothetical protein A3G08_02660 [Candidatus Magasanikbacteria bacterium RIFCSPLOWO2_12_FULL_47_9b]HAZ28939.1 hypothetical protein [Candidatus Magasanikbacteria bacterium]